MNICANCIYCVKDNGKGTWDERSDPMLWDCYGYPTEEMVNPVSGKITPSYPMKMRCYNMNYHGECTKYVGRK